MDRGGVAERVAKLDDEGRHAISIVTVTELRLGVNKRYDSETPAYSEAVEALDRLLARFDLLEVTRPIAIAAADIIAGLQDSGAGLTDLHDVYIAATARTEQLPVLTANVDHFERIDDVHVVDWETY
ncbi:MAG: type II toxin-antitoxin system VapC family toxin [Haloarculaceae archaeon]